jgi:hypothetical protein
MVAKGVFVFCHGMQIHTLCHATHHTTHTHIPNGTHSAQTHCGVDEVVCSAKHTNTNHTCYICIESYGKEWKNKGDGDGESSGLCVRHPWRIVVVILVVVVGVVLVVIDWVWCGISTSTQFTHTPLPTHTQHGTHTQTQSPMTVPRTCPMWSGE